MWIYLVVSLIGFGAGVLGSMFGLGGGFLMVPFLNIIGVDMRVAVGTSASAIFFNMLSSTLAYSRYKYVVYRAGALLSVSAVVTAYFGAQLTKVLDPDLLRAVFGFVLVLVGLRMMVASSNDRITEKNAVRWGMKNYVLLVLGGCLAGFVAGLLGVGGGVVNVPLLTFLGFLIHYAVATSSMAITITSVTSALTHYTLGNIDLGLLVSLTPSLIVGAQIGALTAKKTKSVTLRRGFAVVLWFVAARMILKSLGLNIP
ncbi:MAG: sulfite exporter TauE/SafE family protein [Desulfurococcaceae archaeon TW002]